MSAIPKSVRAALAERSNGVCEACGEDRAEHAHHRKLRSQGGRHELVNLLHVSFRCHDAIHHGGDSSYDVGWLVRSWANPADVLVDRRLAP